jgi:hypothetical protein
MARSGLNITIQKRSWFLFRAGWYHNSLRESRSVHSMTFCTTFLKFCFPKLAVVYVLSEYHDLFGDQRACTLRFFKNLPLLL